MRRDALVVALPEADPPGLQRTDGNSAAAEEEMRERQADASMSENSPAIPEKGT
jgi:hypothetical protein